ncbi:MAG: acetate--CoA ligase family protein [Alphaproteobacteria bacterium]|nr:acetate--CoA ligase family protein [Alphaproteobacteria bacterium]
MIIHRQIAYRGASLFAAEPVVQMTVDARSVDVTRPGPLSAHVAARLARLSTTIADQFGLGEDDADRSESPPELSLAEIVGLTALAVQQEFGYAVGFVHVLPGADDGTVDVVYAQRDLANGLLAGEAAVALVNAALADETETGDERLAGMLTRLLDEVRRNTLSVPTRRAVWEAERRGIPWYRLHPTEDYVHLGQGHKRKRFRRNYTNETTYAATMLASNKLFAGDLFGANGLPVPRRIMVTDADAAVSAARQIGFPVVVKPNYQDMGMGVSIGLRTEDDVRAAFEKAGAYGQALVEEHIRGDDFRLTVIHGRMVAAGQDIAPRVFGDGRSSVRELIEIENRDPRRGDRDYSILTRLKIDQEVISNLAQQGHSPDSIPEAGEMVKLWPWWRIAPDSMAKDVTDRVHPANRAMAERAARLIGLDVAGVDFLTPDITRPWSEVGGAINEINPTPGLNTHLRSGVADIVRMVVDASFPPGDDGRIPTAAITGTRGATGIAGRVAAILASAGHTVGLATADGVEIAEDRVSQGDFAGVIGANMVLSDPLTTAGVLETSVDGIRRDGLAFDRSTVGAVIDAADDGESRPALGLVLETASALAVLNAEDPASVSLAPHSGARRLCWVARDPTHALVARHIADGGLAVALADADGGPALTLWDQAQATPILPLSALGSGREGSADQVIRDAAFAAAIAYGLGVSTEHIRQGLAIKGGEPV